MGFRYIYVTGNRTHSEMLLEMGITDILISYAYCKSGLPEVLERAARNGKAKIMLDSGGLTNFTHPGSVTLDDYIGFLKEWGPCIHEAVTMDDLGKRGVTLRNHEKIVEAGLGSKVMFTDHHWFPWTDKLQRYYGTGEKMSWGGTVGDPAGTLPAARIRTKEQVAKRLEERTAKAREGKRTKVHLLGVGWRIKKFLWLHDVVDSLDSTGWVTNAQRWGKVGWIERRPGDWPQMKLCNWREAPDHVRAKAKSNGWNVSDWNDRCRLMISAYKQLYSRIDARFARALERKEDLREVAKSDDPIVKSVDGWNPDEPVLKVAVPIDLAPVHPSGEGKGEPLEFEEVVQHMRPIVLRAPAVTLVGSLASHRKTENDIDLLVHGPFDDATRRAIEFRLGRMFPPDISGRVQFHTEEMGGPFTSNAKLYDLMLVPREDRREVVRMAASKQDGPHMEWPPRSGPRPGVVQIHAIGRTAHFDFRFKVNGHLVGWTAPAGRKGEVEDIDTVPQARKLYSGYTAAEGSVAMKPVLAPSGLLAVPKSRQPLVWAQIDDRVFEEGEVGASTNERGVMVTVARPGVEWGMQSPFFHEYFLTGDKVWQGVLFVRQLVGDGGSPEEEEAGRRSGRGEIFWRVSLGKTLLPSVLKPRAVELKRMPPLGKSALPKTLEDVTPREFRYWQAKSPASAMAVRDALVESKFFTETNVVLVDGQFRRTVEKRWVFEAEPEAGQLLREKASRDGRFTLSWLFWRGPMHVRTGPSRQAWLLMWDAPVGDGLVGFELQGDPLAGKAPVTALLRRWKGKGLLAADQQVKPGESIDGNVLNDTKATPAWIRPQARGQVRLLEEEPTFVKLQLVSDQIKGTFTVTREEKDSDIWVFERVDSSQEKGGEKGEKGDPNRQDSGQKRCRFCVQPSVAVVNGYSVCAAHREHAKTAKADEMEKSRGPWRQWGGSSVYAGRLVKRYPAHKVYVEPFMGAASCLFTKERAEREVLVDKNAELVFAMKYIQAWSEEKAAALARFEWGTSKAAYERSMEPGAKSDHERFWKFIYSRNWSFSGRPGFAPMPHQLKAGYALDFGRFARWQGRLQGVEIIHGDALKLIPKLDGPDTLFFIDPPWPGEWGTESGGSVARRFLGGIPDLKGLVGVLGKIRGSFILALGDRKESAVFLDQVKGERFGFEYEQTSSDGRGKGRVNFVMGGRGIRKAAGVAPGQRFQPLKPRSGVGVGEFHDLDPLLEEWASPEVLAKGVIVEPKWNGMRAIASRDSEGKVSLWFEDAQDERAHILPGIAADLAKVPGEWTLDAELLDHDPEGKPLPRASLGRFTGPVKPQDDRRVGLRVFRILYWSKAGGDLLESTEEEQGGLVPRLVQESKARHLAATPRKLARTEKELRAAAKWASFAAGSEGAMFKLPGATYSLDGHTKEWAKLKKVRRLHAMVHDAHKVEGSERTFNYTCVVGPIPEGEASGFDPAEVVTRNGKAWAVIGTTGNTSVQAEPGDILQAQTFELFIDRRKGKRRLRWFGPATVEVKRDDLQEPMTVAQVEAMATPTEIRKLLAKAQGTIPIIKTNEERFVLGIVLEPNDGGKGVPLDPDTQGDIYSAEEVRRAAHMFMEHYRNVGLMHRRLLSRERVRILESYIAPTTFEIKDYEGKVQKVFEGTWLLALRIVDEKMWADVKRGRLTGLSIGGSARRVAERKELA